MRDLSVLMDGVDHRPVRFGALSRLGGMLLVVIALLLVSGCDGTDATAEGEGAESQPQTQNEAEQNAPESPTGRRSLPLESIDSIGDANGEPPPRPSLDPMTIIQENDHDELLSFLYWERDPDWMSEHNITMLAYAANRGRVEIVETLLRYGADVTVLSRVNMTPLHWAVRDGELETTRVLLENGADPNARGGPDRDITPMEIATNKGYREIVELLARYGGKP